MSQTEHSGCSLLQTACEHNNEGICDIATQLAGRDVRPTCQECKYCSGLKEPRTENMLTLAMARRCAVSSEIADKLFATMKAIAHEQAAKKLEGPGTELKKIIEWFPLPRAIKRKCTRCKSLERRMNQWGCEVCDTTKRPFIIAKLMIAAKRAKIPTTEFALGILLNRAIYNARNV